MCNASLENSLRRECKQSGNTMGKAPKPSAISSIDAQASMLFLSSVLGSSKCCVRGSIHHVRSAEMFPSSASTTRRQLQPSTPRLTQFLSSFFIINFYLSFLPSTSHPLTLLLCPTSPLQILIPHLSLHG